MKLKKIPHPTRLSRLTLSHSLRLRFDLPLPFGEVGLHPLPRHHLRIDQIGDLCTHETSERGTGQAIREAGARDEVAFEFGGAAERTTE